MKVVANSEPKPDGLRFSKHLCSVSYSSSYSFSDLPFSPSSSSSSFVLG
jgi:hypothetical protein